jgi:predicted nucleic acid-binding protein
LSAASNATPIIYLAKIGRLDLLSKLFRSVTIPKAVYEEVVVLGKKEGYAEVVAIEEAISNKSIIIREEKVNKKLLNFAREIDGGEAEVISLAKAVGADIVLMDDASGRRVATAMGLNVKGTLYVLLKACKSGIISKKECKDCIEKINRVGFRMGSEIYGLVMQELERI